MKRPWDTFTALPRHPFKLARALVRQPVQDHLPGDGPAYTNDLPAWTERFPVVIVHDRIQIAVGIHAILRQEGWRALICATGRDVMAVCQHTPVSMVIAGPALPDMPRTRLNQDLTSHPATRAVPVLALFTTTARYTQQLGIMGLRVPFYPSDLLAVGGEVLLIMGNWKLPPGYDRARAERILANHVHAR